MKKKISEIIVIAVVSFSALIFTTGCGMCYSCGKNTSSGCVQGCFSTCEGCANCAKCMGAPECISGCEDGCVAACTGK